MVCVTPYLSRCLLGVLVSAVLRRLCVPGSRLLSVRCRLVVNFEHMQDHPIAALFSSLVGVGVHSMKAWKMKRS